ncbi:DUF7507 domain-containing protein [Dokdonella ginsengisoli]|uniref:DUF11 domain-containing protein n=1 Tax=Dokdonella ginsengisoli TaxID=363846 RepID=A0ABV9QUH0_9GAMM
MASMLLALLFAAPAAYGSGATTQRDVNPTGGVAANGSDGLRVFMGSNSQFQVNLGGSGQVYSQSGTPTGGTLYNSVYLRVDRGTNATTRVYNNSNNATAAQFSQFTQVSQSAISGSGTAASPWVVTTVLRPAVAADNGITVTLTDSYVRPQGWFTRRVDLSGLPTSGATIKFYQNVDTFLQGGDNGPGFTRTSPGNTSGTPDVVGVIKNSQFEALWYEPSSGTAIWDRYFTGTYSQPSNLICNGTTAATNPCVTGTGNLNNTVDTNASTDNGMAAQWNVPAGVSSYAVEYRVTFAMGAVDLTKGFNPGTIGLNGISTLTFNFSNKTVNAVASMNFLDTLPAGVVVAPAPNIRTNCPAGGTLGTTFPPGMSVTAAAGSGTIQLSGGRINGAAAAGSEIACQVAVDVTSSTAGVYHNTNASITGVNNLTNLVGDEVLAVGIPQLVAGKSVSGGLAAGQTGAPTDGYYVISVQNVGAGPTFGAINLVDNLPAGVSATAVSSADGAVSCGTLPATGTLTCTFTPSVPIPVGGSASVRINVAIPGTATGSVTNVAAVGGGGDPDPLPTCPNASNQQCAQTTTPLSQLADLSITKTDGRTTYTPGAALTYTIVASNAGPSNAAGATVTDTFPAAFTGTWTCVGAGGATCPASGSGNINATVSIPSGGSVTFTVTGIVSAAATGPLSNTATVAVPAGLVDPTPGNNQATDVDAAAPSANLSAVKSGTASVGYGGALSYSVVVTNTGPSNANGSTFSDTLPAGITSIVASCGTPVGGAVCGTVNVAGSAVTSTITTLPVNGSVTFTITGNAPTSGASVTNTASAQPPAGTTDPDPANNTGTATTTLLQPQLTVSKTATPSPFTVGQPASYTITVTNAGAGPTAGNVTVSDALPAGITLTGASGANWSCTGTTAVSCVYTGVLAAGASTTVTLQVAVAASAANGNNTATASGGGDAGCPAAARCSGAVTVPVNASADIVLAKTVDNPAPNVGETVTFTVTASNAGPSNATGVAVTDALPAGLSFVSATPSQGNYDSATGLWTIGALANSAQATLTMTAQVLSAGALSNTATRSAGDQFDPDTSNNAATASLNAQPSADLQVNKTASTATPNLGSNVTFTITVRNGGPNDATGVVVDDALPAGLNFVSATPSQGSYDPGTGVWTIGALSNGAEVTLTMVATVGMPGELTNTAGIAASDQHDPNPANDSSGVTINGQAADIQVLKTVDEANPTRGDTVTFTVTVTNLGPSAATSVRVEDALPAGLSFVSATPSQGSYDPGTGLWTIGNLAASGAGAVATLTVSATVDSDAGATNQASLDALDQADPNPGNNQAEASVTPVASADVSVSKTGPADATPGTNITYTLVVSNAGPSTAAQVSLADPTPAGLTFVSADAPCAGGFPCNLGDLAAGASVTVNVTYAIPANYAGADPIRNTATVSSPTGDPQTDNDSSTVTTPVVRRADVSMSKTAPATATAAGTISYTLVVSNAGPSDANGTTVSDPLPAGLSNATVGCGGETGGAVCGAFDTSVAGTIATLPAGASATITITATAPNDGGTLSNTATATPPAGTTDPDPANNQDTADTAVNASADVGVTKTGPATATPGTNVTYTLVVSNTGPSTATAVSLADPTPAGLLFVSADAPCAGGFPCNLGDLAAGASATVNATYAIPPGQSGTIANTASVTSPTPDPDGGDNTSTVTTGLSASADVSVTKSGPATVPAAGTVTYTLVVSNAGPSDANGTTVSDPLPAGLSNAAVNCSASGGAVCGAFDTSVAGTLTTLPPGGSATITITATAPDDAATLSNTATVAPPPGTTDPDPSGNTSPPVQTQVTPVANLSLLKSGPATVTSGGAISYTLLIANAGPSRADGATYSDAVPSGITDVAASCGSVTGGAVCAAPNVAGNAVSGSIPTLPANGSVTITITGTAPVGAQTLTNTAGVTVPGGTTDPTPGDDTSTVTTEVGSAADIAVSKTVDNAAPNVGETVTFTVTAANQGPNDATGVQVTDGLPAGLTFVSATPSQGTYDSASGLWTVGALADGASATLQISATVTQPGAIVNTATRTGGDQLDPDTSNNAGSAGVNAGTLADLQVNKTADTLTPNLGSDVTFTITVRNAGPSPATGVNVSDVLPAGLAFVSATPSLGAYDETTGLWSVGDLAAGVEQTLTIVATVTQAGEITNTATGAADEPDPNTANNQSGVTPNGQAADLQVVKTVDDANPRLGQDVTFTVTLTNLGPNAATNVRVDDVLPAGLGFVGATPSQGTYDPATGVWTVGDLAASGAGAVATLAVTTTVTQTGAITNVAASAGGDQTDPTPSNDEGSATVTVPASVDVSIVKSGPATVGAGGTISYTLVVANAGPDAANGASYSDDVPAGITGLAASCGSPVGGAVCAAPTVTGNTVAGTVPTLPANGSVTITITGTAPADATTLSNTATVTPPPGGDDPDPSDNTSPPVQTEVTPVADLSIVKTGPAAVASGGTVTYTLTVANAGPSSADGATVSDPLPAGLSGASAVCGGESGGAVCGAFDTTVAGTIATLPAGGSATITITATAPTQAGTLSNTATVAPPAGVTDPQPANDTSATVVTEIGAPMADLSVSKSGPPTIAAGSTLVYTVVVSNTGPDTAAGVQVADPTPPGLVFVGNAGACTTAYPCALGDLASGASATITSTYEVPLEYAGSNPIANTASASSVTADPNPADNSATAQTSVDTGGQVADMMATGAPTQTVPVGTPVTVVTTCTNNGPLAAVGATCTVVVPNAPDAVGGTAGTPATQCVPATPVGNLAVGGVITCTTQFTPDQAGTWTLRTTAASQTPDTIPANDVAPSQVIAVAPDTADLSVSKQGPATASAGGSIVYTLSVTNHGPAAAVGVSLDDPTPAGLSFVSAGAPCAGGFPCAIGTLASGQTATFTATYAIDAGFSGTLTNTATASSSTPDPDPANDSSSSATTVGGNPPVEKVPVPVDARWMLALMGLLLALVAGLGLQRRRD